MALIRGYLEHRIPNEQILEDIEKVSTEDLRESARKYLPSDRGGNYTLFVRDPLMD